MRFKVSSNVLKNINKLSKIYNKPLPIVKYKLDPRIKVGDIISLSGSPTSIKARIEDIKEYEPHSDNIPYAELKMIYGNKIKVILNQQIQKIYIIYVKVLNFF